MTDIFSGGMAILRRYRGDRYIVVEVKSIENLPLKPWDARTHDFMCTCKKQYIEAVANSMITSYYGKIIHYSRNSQ